MATSKLALVGLSVLVATAVGAAAQQAKPTQPTRQPAAASGQSATQDKSAAQPAPAAAPMPVPSRTEIQTFDNWRLTCNDYAETGKRVCVGQLQAVKRETKQPLFSWVIGRNSEGIPESTMVTPTGVAIARGIDLKLGQAPVRRLYFATCEPSHCTAQVGLDAALRREMTSAETAEVIVYGSTGNNMRLELPLRGVDKILDQFRN